MNINLCKKVLEKGGSLNYLLISANITEGLGLTNPSVVYNNGEYLLNLRHVQYTLYHSEGKQKFQSLWGPLTYLNPEDDVTLRTTNYLCKLDAGTLEINSISKVDTSLLDIKPVWEFIGLEDARIVNWENNLYLTGVRRDTKTNGEGRMELSLIKDNVEVKRTRIEPPVASYCEKNWMPILDMPFHYVKWTFPTEIVRCIPETNASETVKLVEQIINIPRDIRGGSQVITVGNYRIALTHEVDLWKNEQNKKDAHYYHRFIVWDKDWNIVAHSEEFKFMTANIEFSCGLSFDGADFIISFGFQDSAAFILKLPLQVFEEMTNVSLGVISNYKAKRKTPSRLKNFIINPFHFNTNFKLAEFYFEQGHTASALGFYLRAAEYGKNKKNVYEALLMVAKCISVQGRRKTTEKSLWLNALAFDPKRPEAYLFLSKLAESNQQYHEAYSYAIAGLANIKHADKITNNAGYFGKYQLEFQQAVSAWWIGRSQESRDCFIKLMRNVESLPQQYKDLVQANINFFDSK